MIKPETLRASMRPLEPLTAYPPDRAVVILPVPNGFQHEEELIRIARMVVDILASGAMPEREIARRLIRYHPAMEGA